MNDSSQSEDFSQNSSSAEIPEELSQSVTDNSSDAKQVQHASHHDPSFKVRADNYKDTARESVNPETLTGNNDNDSTKKSQAPQPPAKDENNPSDHESLYKSIDSYDWANDQVYQASNFKSLEYRPV